MTLAAFEIGIVSADRRVVDFLATVFALPELPPFTPKGAVIHRLDAGGATIKVMVPATAPPPPDRAGMLGGSGIRYLTMRVTDFDDVMGRVEAAGGTVVVSVRELEPGRRFAMIADPDGTPIEVVEAPMA